MKKILAIFAAFAIFLSSAATVNAAEGKYKGRTDFLWGVTSHDRSYESYSADPEIYIKATAETGAKLFRIGFNTPLDIEGLEYLDKIVKLCNEYGMKILVLLRFVTYETEDVYMNTNYFEMVASRYNGKSGHGFIDYFEVGAEEDVRMLDNRWPNGGGPSGDSLDHYYEADIVKWQQLYASCIKGIRAAGKSKIVIDFSHLHYAPLLYMYEHGLDFDIIGLDWYTNMGPLNTVLDPVLLKFPHDIIITETNLWTTVETDQNNLSEYNRLYEFMDLAYAISRVKALLVYELMDEPAFENWENTFVTQEAHFGLCETNRNGTIKSFKPIYYKIQELWGGGPVVKQEIAYEKPKQDDSDNETSSIPNKIESPSSGNSSHEQITESNISDIGNVQDVPKKNIELKQIVETTTKKVFPWQWFIVGSAVIWALGIVFLFGFVIKPQFIKKLFKK